LRENKLLSNMSVFLGEDQIKLRREGC